MDKKLSSFRKFAHKSFALLGHYFTQRTFYIPEKVMIIKLGAAGVNVIHTKLQNLSLLKSVIHHKLPSPSWTKTV